MAGGAGQVVSRVGLAGRGHENSVRPFRESDPWRAVVSWRRWCSPAWRNAEPSFGVGTEAETPEGLERFGRRWEPSVPDA